MLAKQLSYLLLYAILLTSPHLIFGQSKLHFKLITVPESCLKGSASLSFTEKEDSDILMTKWSTGETNTLQSLNLTNGSYFLELKFRKKNDSLRPTFDTTLYFNIEKEACPVYVDKYFSPNEDNYHDLMGISNISYFPDFELEIYNKWGQKIHAQKGSYTPWDGKWNGIDLPDGTYYYILFYEAGNKNKLVKGDVTIIR